MTCIKSFLFSTAIALSVLLSGCGSTPTQDGGDGAVNSNARTVNVPDGAVSDYQDVLKAINDKKWEQAKTLLEKMQVTYPQLRSVTAMQGWVYWQMGDVEKAEATLKPLAEEKNLYRSDAYNYLAIVYREQGKFAEAEAVYKNAIAIWPKDPVLHKNLGILYDLYMNRTKEALSAYKQAQSLGDGDKQLDIWVKDLERRI